MLEALTARETEWARHRGATQGLRTKLASARQLVRVLDAFVTCACEGEAALLAGWASATHVRRTARRAAESSPAVPNAPLRLVMAEAPERREGEPNGRTPDIRRLVALRNRVLALFAGPGGTRIAAGA